MPPTRFWSLGTTAIRRKNGTYCVCAVAEDGDIAHEPDIGARTHIPPGTLLFADRGDWTVTDTIDVPGLVSTAKTFAETWALDWDERTGRWSSPGIFNSVIAWFDDFTPRRPACAMREYLGLGSRLTRILRLDFDMRREARADEGYDYTPVSRQDGEWSVKYNGWLPPPDELTSGSLVAAFLSPHMEEKHYAYLKIGSVLWSPSHATR